MILLLGHYVNLNWVFQKRMEGILHYTVILKRPTFETRMCSSPEKYKVLNFLVYFSLFLVLNEMLFSTGQHARY